MTFEVILSLILDGIRLGILDNISINAKENYISFYYGGIESENYSTAIWFNCDSTIRKDYKSLGTALKRKVKKAQR